MEMINRFKGLDWIDIVSEELWTGVCNTVQESQTIALSIWNFVDKIMSLLFNMLSRFVIVFLLMSKHLLSA